MSTKSICTKKVAEDFSAVTFTFGNGKVHRIEVASFDLVIQAQFASHGLSQKLGDSFASNKGADDAEQRFLTVLGSLRQGQWNAERDATGGLIVDAIIRVLGKPREDCLAIWKELDKDGQKALRANAQIKLAMAEIDLARKAAIAANAKEGASIGDILAMARIDQSDESDETAESDE